MSVRKIFGLVALLMGMVTGANAQVNDTIQRVAGNDLYQGMTRKLPYRQMVTPYGGAGDVCKNGTHHFPVSREVRGLGQ